MKSGRFPDLLIIGGGISGLALAWKYSQAYPDQKISLIEKEADVAQHASGRNSGVLHAGFYYSSDSLKAQLCRQGNQAMQNFCQEHELKLERCGKLVVTASEAELPRLHNLYQQGLKNGVELHLISASETRDLEPEVHTAGQALYSPTTATVDPVEVCQFLKAQLKARGVQFHFQTRYLTRRGKEIITNQGRFYPGRLVNAGGLYADRIAADFGFGTRYTLLPFKGLYLAYTGGHCINRHIYPVPDPKQPFLGVHYTRTVYNQLKIGPTAIPALWRENYHGTLAFNRQEMQEILWYEGLLFVTNRFGFRTLALAEIKKYWRPWFAKQARHLTHQDLSAAFGGYLQPGIRAQLLDKRSLTLVQDFIIEGDSFSTHVLNAVSPAFTCSLAFADHLLKGYLR